jgi:beta-fructofuranosidase
MLVPDGRRIVWGWINGFPNGRGWNGSLSLPRLLSWSRDGQLSQNPAPQLEHLRGKSIVWRNMRLEAGEQPLALPNTNTLEILGRIDLATADVLSLTISGKAATSRPVTIEIGRPPAAKTQADLSLSLDRNDRKLNLRVFIDRSVIEVFANGTLCATKVVAPIEPGSTLSLQARGGAAKAKRIECWPMKTIW